MKLILSTSDIEQRTLSEDDPNVLATLCNMAAVRKEQGRFDDALTIFEDVPQKTKRVLGDNHPHELLTMDHIAGVLGGVLYRHDESVKVLEEVVKKERQVHGHEHPQTLMLMGSLSVTLWNMGKLKEDHAMLSEVLEIAKAKEYKEVIELYVLVKTTKARS